MGGMVTVMKTHGKIRFLGSLSNGIASKDAHNQSLTSFIFQGKFTMINDARHITHCNLSFQIPSFDNLHCSQVNYSISISLIIKFNDRLRIYPDIANELVRCL